MGSQTHGAAKRLSISPLLLSLLTACTLGGCAVYDQPYPAYAGDYGAYPYPYSYSYPYYDSYPYYGYYPYAAYPPAFFSFGFGYWRGGGWGHGHGHGWNHGHGSNFGGGAARHGGGSIGRR